MLSPEWLAFVFDMSLALAHGALDPCMAFALATSGYYLLWIIINKLCGHISYLFVTQGGIPYRKDA